MENENKFIQFKDEILNFIKTLDQNTILKERKAIIKEWGGKDDEKISKFLMNFESIVFAINTLEITIGQEKASKISETAKYDKVVEESVPKEIPKEEEVQPEPTRKKPDKKPKIKEFHVRETQILPTKDERVILQEREDILYRDIFRLLELGDINGALISLERLMVIVPFSERVQEFLKVNNEKIKDLYEERFGNLERIPKPVNNENQIPFKYFSDSKLEKIHEMIDGHNSIIDIIENSNHNFIDVCSSINQLIRFGYVELL